MKEEVNFSVTEPSTTILGFPASESANWLQSAFDDRFRLKNDGGVKTDEALFVVAHDVTVTLLVDKHDDAVTHGAETVDNILFVVEQDADTSLFVAADSVDTVPDEHELPSIDGRHALADCAAGTAVTDSIRWAAFARCMRSATAKKFASTASAALQLVQMRQLTSNTCRPC